METFFYVIASLACIDWILIQCLGVGSRGILEICHKLGVRTFESKVQAFRISPMGSSGKWSLDLGLGDEMGDLTYRMIGEYEDLEKAKLKASQLLQLIQPIAILDAHFNFGGKPDVYEITVRCRSDS